MALHPFVGPWPLFFNFILYTVGRTPWTGNQPVARPLPIHRTTQTQNKHMLQTSIPWVGFEPTVPGFELAKMVHALDRAATVIGREIMCIPIKNTNRDCLKNSIQNHYTHLLQIQHLSGCDWYALSANLIQKLWLFNRFIEVFDNCYT
jgi:hypothetical protein